jgi:ATP-dependent protease HslVU (ClpYQ) peptidase subunit
MTIIVGYKDQGKVWMGCDSCATDGDGNIMTLKQQKIFKLNNQMLIGHTGGIRGRQIIEHNEWLLPYDKENHDGEDPLMQYLCTFFIDALNELFKDLDYSKEKIERDQYLIGIEGRLFIIDGAMQVIEFDSDYSAIGCGTNYALGSLYTSKLIYGNIPMKSVIMQALETACKFDNACSKPFHIMSI